jgi:hypothetical protein
VNGTEWHAQCIVLGDLWKEDSTFGGRIFVSGTHPVHGYRSQNRRTVPCGRPCWAVVWDTCYLTRRSRRSMFYLTLLSNSSMNYCPNNTLTHYTTKLPKITDLDGAWEIGLAETQYPHSWYSGNNNEAWLKVHFYK